MPNSENKQISAPRDAGLDGLRGIAAVSVLLFHVWLFNDAHTTTRRDGLLDYFFVELKLGLYMFFALSGFLLVRPFIRAALDRRPLPQALPYARNRLMRLAPGYWASLAGAALLLTIAGGTATRHLPAAEDTWMFVVFGQGFSADTIMQLNPAAWSLPVELSFYALVPLIGAAALYFARRAQGPLPVIATIVVLAAAMIAAGLFWNKATIGESAVFRLALIGMLPYFALGMLAAMFAAMYERRRESASKAVPAILFGAGLLVLAAGIYNYERDIYADSLQVIRDIPAATGFALMIAGVATATSASRITKTFSWRPLAALGTVSYGIYLWHVPLLLAMRENLLPDGTVVASGIVLAISVALGTLSWKLIEQPALLWSRREKRAGKRTKTRERKPMRHPAIQPRLQPALAGTTSSSSSANLPVARSVSASGYSPEKHASQWVARSPRIAS